MWRTKGPPIACTLAIFASTILPVAVQAPWPSKAITYVVPFAPGGNTDTLARLIAQKLSAALGQPVVIDNKPGAGGNIGSDFVAKAKPDGYTIWAARSPRMRSTRAFTRSFLTMW